MKEKGIFFTFNQVVSVKVNILNLRSYEFIMQETEAPKGI